MEQARTPDGRFAAGNHASEAGQRDAGRYPTIAHDNTRSVGSHTGQTPSHGLGAASASAQRRYERRAK